MTQASNITIKNGASTPVDKIFSVMKISPEQSVFADRSSGVPQAFPTLSVGLKLASGNSSEVNKSHLAIALPIMGLDSGGNAVVLRILRAKVEYILPNGSTDAERKDLDAFVRNALAQTGQIQPNMRDLDPLY